MERIKTESSAHFPRRAGCTPWFFRMSVGTKLNCALNNSGTNSFKKFNKTKLNFAILWATFPREEFLQS